MAEQAEQRWACVCWLISTETDPEAKISTRLLTCGHCHTRMTLVDPLREAIDAYADSETIGEKVAAFNVLRAHLAAAEQRAATAETTIRTRTIEECAKLADTQAAAVPLGERFDSGFLVGSSKFNALTFVGQFIRAQRGGHPCSSAL